jgi:ribosomal protein L39E
MPIQLQEVSRILNTNNQNRTSPQHIIVKTLRTEKKKNIENCKGEVPSHL